MRQHAPTTELEAVNTLLLAIGEAPVNTLDDPGLVDAVLGRAVLTEVSRAVQAEGWHFNTEYDYPLPPNRDGEIILPGNALRADVDPRVYGNIDPVQRGTKFYDRQNHTYFFGTTLKAKLILFLPFTELPEAARRYVTIRATRVFQDRVLGSEAVHQFTEKDEYRALVLLKAAEADTGDYNYLNSFSVNRVLRR